MTETRETSALERRFDAFAEASANIAGRTLFFVLCVGIVVVWLPTYFIVGSLDTWQLIINTLTTIVTFLMVALLQNTQRRSDRAMHMKLNALADGLADLMEHIAPDDEALQSDMRELRADVGIEKPSNDDASG